MSLVPEVALSMQYQFPVTAYTNLGLNFEVKDNAEYYTAGMNACKDYMGELAPFASERQLESFEEIRTDILRNLDSGAV